MSAEELEYYAQAGRLTSYDDDVLAAEIDAAARVVQGVVLHEGWASRYGVDVPADRRDEIQLRSAADIVRRIRALDPAPLDQARPPERRLLGNCRTFATLTTAVLRKHGVSARARAGFGTYFGEASHFIDHWIVEHWDANAERWVRSDTQLDELQCQALRLNFQPLDVPSGRFLSGGEAWQLCRSGGADPAMFGIAEWWGAWFIRNNVVRDLAALNKVELLPWDAWGLMDRDSALSQGPSDDLVDQVAALTVDGDWSRLRLLYEADDRLRAPATFG